MDKRGLSLILCAVFLLGVYGLAGAATTGKITGRIMDTTGGALPGANVVLEGTSRGATADADGYYLILSVEPGTYVLKASMVGYTASTKTDVRVTSDLTATVDFALSEATLELGEITVVAERPPVEQDVTESRYVVSAEEIEVLPIVRELGGLIGLEAGVNADGSDRIRNAYTRTSGGGEVTEYVVDGVRLTMQDGRNWTGEVNPSAVSEVTVLAGGLNAEYGNIGSVQIVTKDGGRDFHGQAHYRFSPGQKQHWGSNAYESAVHRGHLAYGDPDWANETDASGRRVHQRPKSDYTDVTGHFMEGSLSGPVGGNASFFVSSQHNFQPAKLPQPVQRTPFNANSSYKLTFNPSPSMKIRAGGLYAFEKGRWNSGFDARAIFLPGGGALKGGQWKNSDNLLYLSAIHSVSPRTFYEVRLSYLASKQDTADVPAATTDAERDADGWFYTTPGTYRRYVYGEQKRVSLRADLSSQVTRGHFVKAGFNLTRFDSHKLYDAREDSKTRGRRLYNYGKRGVIGEGLTPMELTGYIQDKMEFEGMIVNLGLRYERFWGAKVPLYIAQAAPMSKSLSRFVKYAPFGDMQPLQWILPRIGVSHPITAKSKIQFFYGKYHTRPNFELFFRNRWEANSTVPSRDLNKNGQIDPAEYNNNLFYNDGFGSTYVSDTCTFQNAQMATAFEMGTEWNFIADYSLQATAFYRMTSGLLMMQGADFWDPAVKKTKGKSRDYSAKKHPTTRGMELSLKKGLSHNFSFKAAVNLGWGEELDSGGTKPGLGTVTIYPDETFVSDPSRYWTSWTIDPNTGEEIPDPPTGAELEKIKANAREQIEVREAEELGVSYGQYKRWEKLWEKPGLSSDEKAALQGLYARTVMVWRAGSRYDARRTNGSLVVVYSSPPDSGPGNKYLGSTLFGDLRINMVYRIYTGIIFIFSDPITNVKSKREGPTSATVDFSLQKGFNIKGVRPLLYVEADNLFNHKLMKTQYERTPVDYLRFGLQQPRPNDPIYQQFGDVEELTRFSNEQRQIFVGLRMTW